jgi:hypothetical protein
VTYHPGVNDCRSNDADVNITSDLELEWYRF